MTRTNSSSFRWLPAVVSLALLLCASCSENPNVTKRKAVGAGERYLAEGKLNEAVIEFKNALQLDVNFVSAVDGLGRAYAAKAWYADAIGELRRAQTLDPDSSAIAADLGRTLLEVGAWQEAGIQAERILSREPGNPQGLYIRAAAALGQGRAAEALQLAREALRGTPTGDLHRLQGETLLRLGRRGEAEEAFRSALRENAKDAGSVAGLARVSVATHDLATALQRFNEAKGLDPWDPRIRMGLAAVLAQSGRTGETLKELEAIEPRARSADVLVALATFYLREGRGREAVPLMEPLVKMAPQAAAPRYLLANAYLLSGRPEDATRELSELDRQRPGNPAVQLRLASTELRRGKAREALSRLDAAAHALEKVPEYHLERAQALLLLGRSEEALRAATEAQRLAPQAAPPFLLMGQIRLQQGDEAGARAMFGKAAEADSRSAPAHLALGRLSVLEKDLAAAQSEIDAALVADPASFPALQAKAALIARQRGPKDAIAFVETTLKEGRQDPRLHVLLGGLYLQDRQPEKAEAAYRRAMELDSGAAEPRLALARMALSQGNEDRGLAELDELLARRPGYEPGALLAAALYDKLGRPNEAIPLLERAVAATPDEPALILTLGAAYLKARRSDEAIARMSDLLGRQPTLATARLIRGRAYLAKRDTVSALRDLTEAARGSPRAAPVRYVLAQAQAAAGRAEDAKASYREAIRLDPALTRARLELATLSGERLDPAVLHEYAQRLTSVLAQDPKNVPVREEVARALLADARANEAQVQLQEILQTSPGRPEANLLMARALFAQGKGEEAAGHLQAVLRAVPSDPEASLLLARHLRAAGRREEALQPLEALLRTSPDRLDAKLLLGHLYLETGRLDQALAAAHAVEQGEPRTPAGPLLVGQVLLAKQDPTQAADAFRGALKRKPDLAEAYHGLGQCQQALGQIDPAIASYRHALAILGNDVVALNNLAWILAELRKDPEAALPLAAKAAELAPQSAEVLDTLGWIQYRRGAYAEAQQILGRAAEHGPERAIVQYHLGATYAKLGRKDDAIMSLRRAARLDVGLAKTKQIEQLVKGLGG